MPIYLGSTKINPLYFGGVKIGEAYLGSTKVYSSTPPGPYAPTLPYLIFEFSASGFTPTSGSGASNTSAFGTWHQISSSPNQWYWEGFDSSTFNPNDAGWPCAFCMTSNYSGRLTSANMGGGTCKIIGYGNLDYTSAGHSFTDMDRTFSGCTGLTEFVTIQTPNTLSNVGGCFQDCTELVDGALDQYTYWSTYNTNISNHSGTFTDAGENTVTGLAELNQIPVGWGGRLVPASNTYNAYKRSAATWEMTLYSGDTPIDFANLTGDLYIFTTSSVSSYAGVNMRKSNIWNLMNGFSTSLAATYYYPCFWQGGAVNTRAATMRPTWLRCSATYNGMLDANTSAGDMPGTLDYGTYGPMSFEYGTFASGAVYFGFLVVNDPALISNGTFDPATSPFGIHSNTNFRDSVINWFVQ